MYGDDNDDHASQGDDDYVVAGDDDDISLYLSLSLSLLSLSLISRSLSLFLSLAEEAWSQRPRRGVTELAPYEVCSMRYDV